MNITSEFAKLVVEHPDLPIIPYVDSEVVCEDSGWWVGNVSHAAVHRYAAGYYYDPYGDAEWRYYLEEDKDELIEHIAEYKYEGTEEDYAKAEEEVSQIKWREGIFLYIGLPESPE